MKRALALLVLLVRLMTHPVSLASENNAVDEQASPSDMRFIATLLMSLLTSLNDAPSEDVTSYVLSHQEALTQAAASTAPISDEDVPNLLGEDTIVKSIYRYSPQVVQFYCGGSGLVMASTYMGFYYSADDTPYAMEFRDEAALSNQGGGLYTWTSDNGKRSFHTQRIMPCWFTFYQEWD